jgi:hypothetical protein
MQSFKGIVVAAAVFAALSAAPALAQTTQFMVSGAPVTVGAQPASSGKGYSIYHYRSLAGAKGVTVTCSCDGNKAQTAACSQVNYDCACPSAKVTCD